jgi:MoaA/NifB/PqqE/SkfB family radical SAM enzyme
LNGNFYTLSPEGDVETLKNSLKETGLTFETEGAVPFPVSLDMSHEKKSLGLRELQIRLNGKMEKDCLERQKINDKKRFISQECLAQLKKELEDIPVKTLRIEAETAEPEKISFLLEELHYQKAVLFVQEGTNPGLEIGARQICNAQGRDLVFLANGKRKREIEELQVSAYDFFYRQYFNPCLGHQAAIDCGGEIKPCLWWTKPLGFIRQDNLKNLILSGAFDEHWERTKDCIAVCKDCERRFACNDCRVSFILVEESEHCDGKPAFCNYNP